MKWFLLLALLAGQAQAYDHTVDNEREQRILNLWDAASLPGHCLLIEAAESSCDESISTLDPEDCYKHLNLTDHGFNQVSRYYRTLHRHAFKRAIVYASQWCAAIETAARLGLGYVHAHPMLDLQDHNSADALQTQALRAWLLEQDVNQPLVLVTHRANIINLSDITPEKEEAVLMGIDDRGYLTTLGTMPLSELAQ